MENHILYLNPCKNVVGFSIFFKCYLVSKSNIIKKICKKYLNYCIILIILLLIETIPLGKEFLFLSALGNLSTTASG